MDQKSHSSGDKEVEESRMETSSLKLEAATPTHSGMPECLRNMTQEERDQLEKTLLRKVDRRLLPMMIIIYIMNYLDRNAIGAARLAGLEEDLNLGPNEFQVRSAPRWLLVNR